jgi:hypothetical protein
MIGRLYVNCPVNVLTMSVVATGSKLENSGCAGPPVNAQAASGETTSYSSATRIDVVITLNALDRLNIMTGQFVFVRIAVLVLL